MTRHRPTMEVNQRYQSELASELLEAMDVTEAVQWCVEHGWDGVVRALLGESERRGGTSLGIGSR